jgi:LPS export ABC transporter permease LptG/LPS export ABC transporter permease LptF
MLRTIDRYVIREVLPPFVIVLVVFTFMLLMQPIMRVADDLIAKGVSWDILLRVMPTLLPSALALTIPMALLVGLLIALGRLSEDREWVALQACGVSVHRLLRPVTILAVLAWLATSYVMIWALPDANQAYNDIVLPVLWSRAAGEIKPRVFFTGFPGKVLYVRDVATDGTWRDVFLWDLGSNEMISVASRGRLEVDRPHRQARVVLENVTQHSGPPSDYRVNRGDEVSLKLDPETFFPRMPQDKGYNQKTIAELRADIASLEARHIPAVEEPMAIQQKFSIPVACLVFGFIGLALGVSSRRDGKMASFILGIGVIFVYYVLMYGAQAAAKALVIPPWSARWVPNLILGPVGVAALLWRARFSERELQFGWLSRHAPADGTSPAPGRPASRPPSVFDRVLVRIRVPHGWLPRPRILDWYIAKTFLRILALTIGALLVIFYISEFIEQSERVFRGTAKPGMVFLYFVYKTPWFVYYIIPLGGLIATLVTYGLLTRNSELVIMKACGVSLYRAALPVFVFALLCGAALFGLEERVLAKTNREWHKYDLIFKGMDPDRADMLNRGWVVSRDGRAIYHFESFHQDKTRQRSDLNQLSVYTLNPAAWRMTGRSFATRATYSPASLAEGSAGRWIARNGWSQQFAPAGGTVVYTPFRERPLALEPPDYFGNEQPDAERMNYFTLKRYVEALRAGGFNEAKASVDLQRKIAFPCVAIVMSLIAVPFAVTMGRRGAMYGIGLGVVLAIAYWVTAEVFAAFGAGGVLPPVVAAWAPNLLFSGGAVYGLLTVRT